MNTFPKTVACIAALTLLSVASLAMAKEDSMDLDKAPAPVQTAAKALLGDKKCDSVEKEDQKGQTVYEIEYKVNGTGYGATINETGDVIEHEVDIDQSAVPANILDAVHKAHDGGTITEASIVNADAKFYYEFDVKVGDQTFNMKVSPKAKINHDAAEKSEAPAPATDDKK